MITATLLALAVQLSVVPPPPARIAPAPRIPPARNRTPQEEFELAARNLFELVARPDSKYNPFVHFSERTRVLFVYTGSNGLARSRQAQGEGARQMMRDLLGPQLRTDFRFGTPEVRLDGAFGRARLAITGNPGGEQTLCGFAYFDAMLVAPGSWARSSSQGMWEITQITIAFEKYGKCPK